MSISYTGADAAVVELRGDSKLLLGVMIFDAFFSATTIFWWTLMSLFIAEPIRWATWTGISSRPELFEYPFSLLWMLPLASICVAWVAKKAGRNRLAMFAAFFPILLFGMVVGWYHLTPPHWR